MKVPTIGSTIRVKIKNFHATRMIPAGPEFKEYTGKVLASYNWLTDRQFCLSGNNDFPIRVISMESVENITLLNGSFKNVDTSVKTFEVEGSKGKKYVVTSSNQGWTCTCMGFQFRRQCKHVSEFSQKTV